MGKEGPLTDEAMSDADRSPSPKRSAEQTQPLAERSLLKQAPLVAGELAVATPALIQPPPTQDMYYENRDRYEQVHGNPVRLVTEEPVSTFSIDVDTAAYANMRRFLNEGTLPPVDAVRIEEFVNYFDYASYAVPKAADQPFAADMALFDSPWDPGRQLLRIGIRGYEIERATRPPARLVFLIDTSGSMSSQDKLPLVQRSLRMLVDQMEAEDSIGIVAYAGNAGVVLEPTPGDDKRTIRHAIERLSAGGSTAGAQGLERAYELAEEQFDSEAVNRVILRHRW